MAGRILLVDDDRNILDSFKRQLRNSFDIHTATGGAAALELIEKGGPFSVVCSDMQMPVMSGLTFLSEVRTRHPEIVRLMLTGNADQETAVKALNQSAIFRFLHKPVSTEDLSKALTDALEQHRLITAEKELLQHTLSGSVKMLTDLMSAIDPISFGKVVNLREKIRELCNALGLKNSWEIELSAMLSNIGLVLLPPIIAARVRAGADLTPKEHEIVAQIPKQSRELLLNIPRLDKVAQIVYYHGKNFDGSGYPIDQVSGEAIPLGARIIRIVNDFYELQDDGTADNHCLLKMRSREGRYDPKILGVMANLLAEKRQAAPVPKAERKTAQLTVTELKPALILASDVKTIDGVLIAPAGTELNETNIERFKNYADLIGIVQPIVVYAS